MLIKILKKIKRVYERILKELNYLIRYTVQLKISDIINFYFTKNTPTQKPLVFNIDVNINNIEDLKNILTNNKIEIMEGKFTIYIEPKYFKNNIFKTLYIQYPKNSGLKIIKNVGRPGETKYVNRKSYKNGSIIAEKVLPNPMEHVTVSNFGNIFGIFPKCFDLVEIITKNNITFTAFVVEHIEGRNPNKKEFTGLINKIEKINENRLLGIINPNWKSHKDFIYPNGLENTITKENGEVKYIDFQNFFFLNKNNIIKKVLKESVENTHFGDEFFVIGGKYSYQSVPGLTFWHKRNISKRFITIERLCIENHLNFNKKIIMDIGCNIGIMMAEVLSKGAMWAIGMDLPEVTKNSSRILSLLGFSRFDIYGVNIDDSIDFCDYIPNRYFKNKNTELILFYFAVRKHIGFPPNLKELPWKYMFYEGHENETIKITENYLNDFCFMVNSSIVQLTTYQDSGTRPRSLALLKRNT